MISTFNKHCIFCNKEMGEFPGFMDEVIHECLNSLCKPQFLYRLDNSGNVIFFAFNVDLSNKIIRIYNNIAESSTIFAEKLDDEWDRFCPNESPYSIYDDTDLIDFKSYEHAKSVVKTRMVFK